MKRSNIVIAPNNWCLDDPVPSTGGRFDGNWRGIYLSKIDDEQFWNGTSNSGLFGVRFNSSNSGFAPSELKVREPHRI